MAHYDGAIRINTKLNTQGFNTGIQSMTASLGKLAAAVGIAFSVGALVKMGKQAIDLASDIQEVDNVVSKSFGHMRGEMDALANTAIEKLGMSRLTAYKTGSTFMAMGKSMLDSAEDAKDMALALTEATGNLSSFYNVTQDVASTALKSIYTGETETLKQFGIVMTETNLQQFAQEQGIRKTISAMSQSEKVTLRYKYVMEQLAFVGSDFADTQDSWANQTRILSEQWKELLSILGSGLITVLTPVVKGLNNIVASLINVANAAGKILSDLFGIQAQQLSVNAGSAEDAADAMTDYGNATEAAAKKAKNATAAFDDLNVLQSQQTSGGNGGGFGGGSGVESKPIIPDGDSAMSQLELKMQSLLDKLSPFTAAIKKLWDEGLSKLASFTVTGFKDFYDNFLKPLGTWAFGTDDAGFTRLINIINNDLLSINWDVVNRNLRNFWAAIEPYAEAFGEGLIDFFEDFSDISIIIFEKVFGEDGLITGLTDFLNANDPENAREWGYALAELATAFLLFRSLGPVISNLQNALSVLGTLLTIYVAYDTSPITASNRRIENISNALEESGATLPQREDYETLEDYNAALAEFQKTIEECSKTAFQLPGVEYDDETNYNKYLVDLWDNITKFRDYFNNLTLGDDVSKFFNDTLWNWDISGWWESLDIGGKFEALKQSIADGWESISDWWYDNAPLAFVREWWTDTVVPWWNDTIVAWWTDTVVPWGAGVVDAVKNFVWDVIQWFMDLGKSISDIVADITYNIASLCGATQSVGGIKMGGNTLKTSNLPHLATGAVIPPNQQFLAILGDQKSGTNIEAPLSTIENALQNVFDRNSGSLGNTGNMTVVLEIDGKQFARAELPHITKEVTRIGTNFRVR